MEIILSNPFIKATFNTLGGELIALEDASGCGRIWHGDTTYWGGHSPLLFPIIGSLNNNTGLIKGQPYTMGNHGFARRSEFTIIAQTQTELVLQFASSPTTLSVYPYDFVFQVTYTLVDNQLRQTYVVTNPSQETIYFQFGTHPAFCFDFDLANQLSDWRLDFEAPENFDSLLIEGNLINYQSYKKAGHPGTQFPLSHPLFYEGALVFEYIHSQKITLRSNLSSKSVILEFANLPHMAIWQPLDAPFICIEPWQGMGDPIHYTGDFEKKPHMVALPHSSSTTFQLHMTFTS